MTPSDGTQAAGGNPDAERRHAKRYQVELNAVSHQADGSAIACEIKDVCVSGMYISFSQSLGSNTDSIPDVGDQVRLECFIPANNAVKRIMLTAKIVRHYANGAGVAFINPEPAAIDILRSYIENHARKKQESSWSDTGNHGTTRGPHKPAKTILNDCAKIFAVQAAPLIKQFLEIIDEEMIAAAEKASNNVEQSDYFDSLNVLHREKKNLQESFHKAVIQELNSYSQKQNDRAADMAIAGNAELSIMEEESLESWLAIKNSINLVKTRHNKLINELESRLSTLYRKNINGNNNPFDPGIYAHAFDSALKQINLSHKIYLFCFSVFNKAITESLEQIYGAAIDILKDNGIDAAAPSPIKTEYKDKKTSSSDNKSAAANNPNSDNLRAPDSAGTGTSQTNFSAGMTGNAGTETSQPGFSGGAPSGAGSGTSQPTYSNEAPNNVGAGTSQPNFSASAPGNAGIGTSQAGFPGSAPTGAGAGTNQPSYANGTPNSVGAGTSQANFSVGMPGNAGSETSHLDFSVDESPAADNIATEHDVNVPLTDGQPSIYNLVRELQQLKAQIRNQSYSGNIPPGISSPENGIDNDESIPEFSTNEILSALSELQKGMSLSGSSDIGDIQTRTSSILTEQGLDGEIIKRIAPRHSNIMDVTSNLFETLLHDVLIADSVRQWVNKLEIPVLKLALKDDTVFTDRNHSARQVLNKISQLEGYTTLNANGEKNAIWTKIDALLDRIITNIDRDPGVFRSSLKEVDALIKIQDKAFAENVQEVINECEQNCIADENDDSKNIADRPGLQPWEKQALRLRPDDWLNFINTTSGIQRLRLAWIAKNRDRFVFVNLKGLKETVLNFEQISQRLREGTIIPLGNDDEPALDRAQQSMLDKLHKQLIFESTHDPLTGLINRREFEQRLDARLLKLSDKLKQDVLCYLDVAQFSAINSTYGYEAGDKLLTEMSNLLLRTINGRGQLARVSNDAYAILLEEQTVTDARNIIQQQLNVLKDYRFEWDDQELSISINTGLVPVSDYEAGASELLRIAEICCTSAKDKGNNRLHIYQRDDIEASLHQDIIRYVLQIENTIGNHNIELMSQKITPIHPDEAETPYHSEIIIRVKDDQGKPLPTQDFILAAEHHNRITTLDRWVVTSVLEWMQQHQDQMADIGGFAINLSGKSLNDPGFLDFIYTSVTEAGIPTDWICFEITETADIDNLSDAAEFIRRIKETGCHFSLDDFGSGLSSYTYLKNLPVDYLKIDGTFVRNMHENANDYAVVKSICDIGHFMGKKIIAEFVENDEILDLLRELGADYAQGWGIEKPQALI